MNDDSTVPVIRAAFDAVMELAPEMPQFDEILAEVNAQPNRPRLAVHLGVLVVGVVLVVAVSVATFWFAQGGNGETVAPIAPSTTTSTLTSNPTDTLANGFVYSQSDCPLAANVLVGGYEAADALPERSQTERDRVEGMLEAIRQSQIGLATVIDVRAVPRNGEVWYRLADGDYAVEMADDYQFEFILAPDAPCPAGPSSVNGVPILYNRADDKSVIDSASTDSLQLSIIDIYPNNPGIDSLWLKNTNPEAIDISNWTIASSGYRKSFTVPQGTVLETGESIAIYQLADSLGAECRKDTARAFFHCNALEQDTVTGEILFPTPNITIHDQNGALVLESQS